jgi:uracil-DNA glycosylase
MVRFVPNAAPVAGYGTGVASRADDYPGAEQYLPADRSLEALTAAVPSCRGCDLWQDATQAVFGEGPARAGLVLVGEQPGDVEDREGEPFVGPAGRLLDRALADAGLSREEVYLTNAVKHFRFTQSGPGKRRMHQTPDLVHMTACRPWLVAEMQLVRPAVVVCLGATAVRSLLGTQVKVMRDRGAIITRETSLGSTDFLVTLHPSAVLRSDDRDAAYAGLVADLRVVTAHLGLGG